ncbi:MAG: RidA family protein [Proteobacteria bacterium]|nr:RidA family protein [Pseudomonadota bacterium]
MITRFPSTAPFLSSATVHNGTVYTQGQVAFNKPGAPIAEQCADIFQALDTILEKVGSDKDHILSATIWLTDISTGPQFNEAWMKWLGADKMPARACIESRFINPAWHVEVALIAAVKEAA